MKNKLQLLAACLMLVSFLFGCSSVNNPSGGSNQNQNTNNGSITGYVYDNSLSNAYTNNLIPLDGASVTIADKITTTDANGKFTLSEIPSGQVEITASKSGYDYQTVSLNKNSVKFYLSPINYPDKHGNATLTGSINGLPSSVAWVSGRAFSNTYSSFNFNYDSNSKRYTLTNAPDDGETYLFSYYSSPEGSYSNNIYSYKKFICSGGTKEVNLEFGPFNSVNANISLPSGYKINAVHAGICKMNRYIGEICSKHSNLGQNVTLSTLPPLESEDSYGVSVIIENQTILGEAIEKDLYNVNAGSCINFDFSSMYGLKIKDPTPIDGSVITSNPTISWEPVTGNNITYSIHIYTWDSSAPSWQGVTQNTSITVPSSFTFVPGQSYSLSISAVSSSGFDLADYYSIVNSYLDCFWYAPSRYIYYGYKGSSINSLGSESIPKLRAPFDRLLPRRDKNEK